MSLGTRDIGEARQRGAEHFAEVNAMFRRLRGDDRALSPVEIERLAQRAYEETLDDLQQLELAGDPGAQFYSDPDVMGGDTPFEAGLLHVAHEDGEAIALGGDPVIVASELARVEKRLGGHLDAKSPSYDKLVLALHRARRHAALTRLAALRGERLEPPAAFNPEALDVRGQPIGRAAPLPENVTKFSKAAEAYLEETQRDPRAAIKKQTEGQYQAVYRLFDQWAGGPTLDEITRAKASDFLDTIASLDPMWGRSPNTKKRTFKEIAAQFGSHPTGLGNRTINRYSTALSLVWKWAKKTGRYDGENPWEDQQRKEPEKRKSEKLPFAVDELSKLLQATPTVRPNRHDTASALPWLCLIAAYSGMRLNEICSLRTTAIQKSEGVWFFDVTEAKTEAGDRRVPIHSAILKAGLLEFVKHGDEWLFPGLKAGGPDDKRSWYVSKRFTELRRGLGVVRLDPVSGKDKVDFHSFRRSAIQALERARVPQSEAAQIVGHERAGITFGTYNPEGLTMVQRRKLVEKITYQLPVAGSVAEVKSPGPAPDIFA